jgi:hypothetical protein
VRRVVARVAEVSRSILDHTTIADALAGVASNNETVTPIVQGSLSRPSPRRTLKRGASRISTIAQIKTG